MVCNAWNHKADCNCNFRGGHPNAKPPARAPWAPKSYSEYLRQSHQYCEKCGAIVFFIKFQNGGGGFFDRLGRPWQRHGCLNPEEIYDPFTKRRVPRMKMVKSEYERDGWMPLFNISVETDMLDTVIKAQSLDAYGVLVFLVDEPPYIDTTAMSYYRDDPNRPGVVEIDYFDRITGEPKTLFAKRAL